MADSKETQKKIPSFELTRNYNTVRDEIREAIEQVLESQHFIMGPDVAALEEEIAGYLGVTGAAACASGTDALILALMSLGIGPGDEVLTTPYTFFATASAVTRLGARPVFVDVETDSYNINLNLVEQALSERTKAFIPVHLFGLMSPVQRIAPSLKSRGVPMAEDCAQSFGAVFMEDGQMYRSGAVGDVSCFSFFPTKNLGCYGDGGMCASGSPDIIARLRKLRVHGAASTYIHDEVGINSRLDTLQAAILRVRLRHVEEWNSQRRSAAARYRLLFMERGLERYITVPHETEGAKHIYHQYVIRAQNRDALAAYLEESGITARIYYPLCLHMQPCFSYLGYGPGDFPAAEALSRETLALPMFPELSMEEQIRIADTINRFYQEKC